MRDMSGEAPTRVRRAVDGSLLKLYCEQQVGVIRLGVIMLGDEASAEDVVQDVFARMFKSAPDQRDEAKLLAYARSAVLNGCRQVLRRRKLAWRHVRFYERPVWSAESAVLLREDRRDVMEALRRLPRRKREVLILRFYLELSDVELARTLGIRPVTVRSTMSRALSSLAKELGEES